MRFFISIVFLGLIVMAWNKHMQGTGAAGGIAASTTTGGGGSVVVINFTSNQDLIAQLRQVNTGHVVETHFTGSTEPVSSGLQCSDHEAVAAYQAEMNRKLAEENRIIEAEYKRIEGQ